MQYEERLVRELPEKSEIELTDYLVLEDLDGTKLGLVSSLRGLMMKNLVFKTVEDMKSSDVHDGDYCITLGYHTPGDGGAAIYMIVYEPVAVEDGANWHYLYKSDVNRAKFITLDGSVTPEQFGAYGDGSRDDTDAINKCIQSGYRVNFIQKHTYKTSSPLELKSKVRLNFNGCILKPAKTTAIAISSSNTESVFEDIILENAIVDMSNAKSNNVINIAKPVKKFTIRDFTISGGDAVDIETDGVESLLIENCKFRHVDTTSVAIEINKSLSGNPDKQDYSIRNCYFENCLRAITLGETSARSCVSVEGCTLNIMTAVAAATTFIYDGRTGSVGRMISLNNIHTTNVDSVLNTIGADWISIRDVYLFNAKKLFDANKVGAVINLEGSIVLEGDSLVTKVPVFDAVSSDLFLKTVPKFDANRYMERTASNKKYTGTLYDMIGYAGRPVIQTSATTTLSVTTMGNVIYEFTASGVNLNEISGGIEGQTLLFKFNAAAKIYNSGTIALNNSTTQTPLSVNAGGTVMFKCRNGKFVQI